MFNQLASVNIAYEFSLLPHIVFSLHVNDIFDILIVTFFIYLVLVFIKQTRSFFLFNTFVALFLISFISQTFDLSLTRKLIEPILTFFIVIFVVVFQREIRKFFNWFAISRKRFMNRGVTHLSAEVSESIVSAVMDMAKRRIGAIIVLSGEYPLDDVVEGGFPLDGRVSIPLLLSIFDDSTPGHDGAVLIENKRLSKFGLHLPLAENFKGFATQGTRHRAAVGITERSDSLAIVVSEERGTVSVARNGIMNTVSDAASLENILKDFMKENVIENKSIFEYLVFNNFLLKIASLLISIILWILLVYHSTVVNKDFVVPVQFIDVPQNEEVANVNPLQITLTFSGGTASSWASSPFVPITPCVES